MPEEDQWAEVRLVDLSSHGLRMEVTKKPPLNSTLQLRFQPEGEVDEFFRSLRIRWIQMSVRGHWWVGGELLSPLPKPLIQRLSEAGCLERRKQPRYTVERDVKIKWELAKQWEEAQLRDYSVEGFQLRCANRVEPAGSRLLMRIPPSETEQAPMEFAARIAWQMTVGDRRAIGCEFLRHQQFSELRRLIGPPTDQAPLVEDKPVPRRWPFRAALVLALAVTAAVSVLLSLWGSAF